MSPIAAFVLGVLFGWLVEWIIDWLYWRRKRRADEAASRQADTRLESLKVDLKTAEADKASLSSQLTSLRAELAAFKARQSSEPTMTRPTGEVPVALPEVFAPVEPPQAVGTAAAETVRRIDLGAAAVPAPVVPDDLIVIKGIGPVIARKLNDAGIFTFRQLAAITPARLRQIVGDVIQRLANEGDILAQAKDLADKKDAGG